MIVLLSLFEEFPVHVFESVESLARAVHQPIGVIALNNEQKASDIQAYNQVHPNPFFQSIEIQYLHNSIKDLSMVVDQMEASMLIIPLVDHAKRSLIRKLLRACHSLRIPYLFMQERHSFHAIHHWLVPVGFLPEEKEKGVLLSTWGPSLGTSFTLLSPKDYGSRAKQQVQSIENLLTQCAISHQTMQGKTDSFKIQQEAVKRASKGEADGVILMASREYDLDDLIFGPPEQRMMIQSKVPLLFLNPRSDLYLFCRD